MLTCARQCNNARLDHSEMDEIPSSVVNEYYGVHLHSNIIVHSTQGECQLLSLLLGPPLKEVHFLIILEIYQCLYKSVVAFLSTIVIHT